MNNPRDKGEGWVGFDLDGTLALYDGFKGDDHIGDPIEPMVRKARQYIQEGRDVRLFTARKPHPAIRRWMYQHLGTILPITNVKDHQMQALYDDRAVGIRRNEGVPFDDDNEKQIFQESEDGNDDETEDEENENDAT